MPDNQIEYFKVLEENIRKYAKEKGITLNDLIIEIEMTEGGFYKMLKAGSMKISTLKKIADVLEQPIQIFFEGNKTVQKIKGYNNVQANHSNVAEPVIRYQVENLEQQIAQLKSQLNDKDEIIQLLRMKING